ncbi:hypothetical protein GTP91_14805 [Rugamonas sp. FT82W]|uniref:Toxin-antitoxin system YwqK family antitoxin n=1 Tax=Duganella vulcania TaxID=2692166 RepID=A0A845G673_9BURK|nr:hypothetical protein [Duganella vulcania]MYM88437.1 hypothetical protein [Duganella vulcania]
MSHTTTAAQAAAKLLLLAGLMALQGCSREIDVRLSHVEQGLVYKKDASDPFTGKLTNVDIIQVGKRYAAQYGAWEGGCTVPVQAGLFDGVAECTDAKGKKVGEFTYSKGQQDGAQKMWASDSGNLMLSMTVRGGVPDGIEERYNPKTGKIISHINYEAGKPVGEEKRWDITGETLLTDLTWQNGGQTGVYRYSEREEHYKVGVRDGIWKMCQLNRSIAPERLKANYEKAQTYYALAEKLGGTYFLPALVDDPSGVECTETVYVDGVKQAIAVANTPSGSGDSCLDTKIAAFRKENGEDVPINHSVIEEWEAGCKK